MPADEGGQGGQVRFELGSLGLRPVLEAQKEGMRLVLVAREHLAEGVVELL